MTWIEQHWLRLLFLAGYLMLLVYSGWKSRQQTSTLADYLIAGRSLGGWIVALSFYATFVSTNTFVGHAGKGWSVGLVWYANALTFGGLCYLSWYIVAPRFVAHARHYQSLTVADFLGHRYQSSILRQVAAVVILIASILYLLSVYKGSALALHEFLGVEYQLAACILFVVVTAYTLVGGFRSVVFTDALQGLVMIVGAVALVLVIIYKGGGLSAIVDRVQERDPQLISWQGKMPWFTLVGLSLAGGMKMLVDPRLLSRFYGLRNNQALGFAQIAAPLLIVVTYVALLPVGVLAHGLVPANAISDSDHLIPYLLGTARILGTGFSSFFLLVLLSAAMSSLDSVLLVAASSIGRDLLLTPDTHPRAIARTRWWVVLLSLVSLLLALNPFADIVEVTAFSGSLYAACFLPTLVLGLYWRRGTAIGSLACVIVGAVVVIIWFTARWLGWTSWHEVYVGLPLALLTYVIVSLRTPSVVGSQKITGESGEREEDKKDKE